MVHSMNIVGWGNSEFQHYTDSTDNSFMDGNGNLVIRLQETAPTTPIWSAGTAPASTPRPACITQDQLDFEYGRIEARVQVPDGPSRPLARLLDARRRHPRSGLAPNRRD
jgi:hypothetical protein